MYSVHGKIRHNRDSLSGDCCCLAEIMANIDYKSEALRYLELRSKGDVGTQKEFFEARLQETGLSGSFQYFKKTLKLLRASGAELPPEPDVKLAKTPNPPPPKEKSVPGKKRRPKKGPGEKTKKEPKPRREKKKTSPPADKPERSKKDKRARKDPAIQPSPDWEQLKRDYLTWRYATIREVAVAIGWNYMGTGFREATAGWRAERAKLPRPGLPATLDALARERAVQKARDLYADALAAHYKLMDLVTDSALNAGDRWKKKDDTQWHTQMGAAAATELAKAMEKIIPAIKGLENLRCIHKIFDDLGASGDIVTAALDLAKLGVALPKPVEILLTKHKPEEVPPDDGMIVTDEEIMRRRAELLAEIRTERVEFVAERKRVVAKLKAETADSFKAQKEIDDAP